MATLVTGTATLKIEPCVKETPTSNWIDTILGIEYHIQNQKFYIESPKKEISIRVEGFNKLVQKSREYIKSLPVQGKTIEDNPEPFYFYPLEQSFSLEIGSGSFFDESRLEGGIFVTFNMPLRSMNIEEIKLDSIGCTVWVTISDYLLFLDNLEQEVKAVK
ncbi:MAG: hypothetical protein GFH27_549307n210 [Chloroflexi bacterium AL-W]|nr:hypothetical protein [Chloroflexi bacterium AL-N1]NOK69243.1 hypothetical protein [Chloroflexi bacterium AL-N10]NOK77226.1 hypothetical protein [Chloroflexi bacterium AL-N5]NOK83870.1 hypothetical protein [Chloroflexi bacterium AL-W]NOK91081.1 hypothetical protein [Chloroflexi bacterium AL-N15]